MGSGEEGTTYRESLGEAQGFAAGTHRVLDVGVPEHIISSSDDE
jgi:hypothetical protein